jgi:hypothetical protein
MRKERKESNNKLIKKGKNREKKKDSKQNGESKKRNISHSANKY